MHKLKKLRLGFIEAGCGWAPFLISKIEERLETVSLFRRGVNHSASAQAFHPILMSPSKGEEKINEARLAFHCKTDFTNPL
jgi:hypothetical protein